MKLSKMWGAILSEESCRICSACLKLCANVDPDNVKIIWSLTEWSWWNLSSFVTEVDFTGCVVENTKPFCVPPSKSAACKWAVTKIHTNEQKKKDIWAQQNFRCYRGLQNALVNGITLGNWAKSRLLDPRIIHLLYLSSLVLLVFSNGKFINSFGQGAVVFSVLFITESCFGSPALPNFHS